MTQADIPLLVPNARGSQGSENRSHKHLRHLQHALERTAPQTVETCTRSSVAVARIDIIVTSPPMARATKHGRWYPDPEAPQHVMESSSGDEGHDD